MKIGWLCPFEHDRTIVVGAVVESLDTLNDRHEYIPVVLPESSIAECAWRGTAWVVSMIPEDFFAFDDEENANQFLFLTFKASIENRLSVSVIEVLLDAYQGEPRNMNDYGVLYDIGGHGLN